MNKVWQVKEPNIKLQKQLASELDVSQILAQLLINRGIENAGQARDFLDCDLIGLHDPFLFKGMDQAVQRVKQAISRNEQIMVWGDYDIDGITSVAVLITTLKDMGAKTSYYLPNRLVEGYGLNKKGAQAAKDNNISLIITVDCGISDHQEIAYLNELGIDTIVTDHHQLKGPELPAAHAIINPFQKECSYPFKRLAGVGVAAKFASALLGDQEKILNRHLDIITLGTVGDIVPLRGENRTLVKHGLNSIMQTEKLGLLALLEACSLHDRQINAGHIGFILGPRNNASGRLGSPEDSLNLLLTMDKKKARDLAQRLEQSNRHRRKIESQTLQEAVDQVERKINFKQHNIIVLGAPNWHQGVIGIVASRLVDRYFRPTIMMSLDGEFGKGSGRSIDSFHLLNALTECKDLLEEYGGHSHACGLKLKEDNFDKFFETINQLASKTLVSKDLISKLDLEMVMPLSDLNMDLINQLDALEPFGADNPRPVICSYGLKVKSRAQVIGGKHLKFWVTDGNLTCEAIGFNKARVFPQFLGGENIDLAYSPSINNWQGNSTIQLKIEDLKIN